MREGGMKENNFLPDKRLFNSPSDLMIFKKKKQTEKNELVDRPFWGPGDKVPSTAVG